MKHFLVIALVAAAACGKSKSECKAEADELTALLSQADPGGSLLYIDDSNGLVTRTDLPQRPTISAPVVILNATETVYQGQLVDDDGLRERLAAAIAKITEDVELGRFPRTSNPPDPKQVYFMIHAATPWSRVVAAVKAAGDVGMDAPMFVFAHPTTSKPPPRTSVDTELEAFKADGNKATKLAEIISAQIKNCKSLIRLFGQLGGELSDRPKDQILVEGLGPALVECNCDVNYPQLRSVLWHLLVNQMPARVVMIDPAAPKETIALPATTTWADANKRLTASTTGVTFVVE